MKRLVVAAMAALAFAPAATAQRPSLDGFENFRFGMSEQELRKLADLREVQLLGGRETAWDASQPITVSGIEYRRRFLLKNQKLDTIILVNDANGDTFDTCFRRFERALGSLEAKYGQPDRGPERDLDTTVSRASAEFKFPNAARITILTFYSNAVGIQPRGCSTSVHYQAAGNSF